MLTQERLKELLHYCPDSGVFTRLKSTSSRVKVGDIAGWKGKNGYIGINVGGVKERAHRLAFLYMTGDFPVFQADHINGIRDDNRWVNLRQVTASENGKNHRMKKNNKSGVTGVYWCKNTEKWRSQIFVNGKCIALGRYDNFFDAICSRKSAELKHGFHPNHGRMG